MRELLVTLRKDIGIKDEQEEESIHYKLNYNFKCKLMFFFTLRFRNKRKLSSDY